MPYYSRDSNSIGFIVYSKYGVQSHVAMNNYGAVFSCNPIINEDRSARVFTTYEEAEKNTDTFHNVITETKFIAKVETH